MARKTIIVCDVCESAQGIRTWEVKDTSTGAKKKVELCVTHSTPLARLFEESEAPEPVAPKAGGRRRTPVVATEDL